MERHREFFLSGKTLDLDFREKALGRLESAIRDRSSEIVEALRQDLRRPEHETWISELSVCFQEVRLARKKLRSWARVERTGSPLLLWPSRSEIYHEPYGVALIIGPWNYPFQLAINPLIAALAAGCCAVVKPSENTPATSRLIARMIGDIFPAEYVSVVEGGVAETTALLDCRFDKIFFTGSTAVGRIVMLAAAKNLTPVTLELGGKSPVIVDETADLKLAARRIAWGKVFNAGQTCVAPDYVYAHAGVADELLRRIEGEFHRQLGVDPKKSADYARIVNIHHHRRLVKLLNGARIYHGGACDESDLYVQPTLVTDVKWEDPLMSEEIFGPILPVLTYVDLGSALGEIRRRPKPLSAYLFSRSRENERRFVSELSFGGGCVNDVVVHLTNPSLPFGGVGESGMGNYHGKAGFLDFSHAKGMLRRTGFLDIRVRYAPYTRSLTAFYKKVLGYLS